MTRNHQAKESGQSLVVIAGIVLVLLALVALVVDVGNAYAQRRIAQNAVDAAAMAGALKLAEHDPERGNLVGELTVWQVINEYATANGLSRDKWVAWFIDSNGAHAPDTVDQFMQPIPAWANGVEVKGQLPFDTYFAHLIGFDVMEVNAEASAFTLRGPCSFGGLFPLAVNVAGFEEEEDGLPVEGKEYILFEKQLSASGKKVEGWWWVHWEPRGSGESPAQGPSDTVLNCNMIDPSRSGLWRVGNWVQRADGVKSWPKMEAVLQAQIMNTGESMATCDDTSKSVTLEPYVIIPLFDEIEHHGCGEPWDDEVCNLPEANHVFRIAAFAKFRLTCFKKGKLEIAAGYDPETGQTFDCESCGSEKEQGDCIKGYFVEEVSEETFEDGCPDTSIVAPSYRHPSPTATPLP